MWTAVVAGTGVLELYLNMVLCSAAVDGLCEGILYLICSVVEEVYVAAVDTCKKSCVAELL